MRTSTATQPTAIESIQSLIRAAKELLPGDEGKLDAIQRRTRMLIRRLSGASSTHMEDYNGIIFASDNYYNSDEEWLDAWRLSQTQLLNLLTTMLEEAEVFGTLAMPSSSQSLYTRVKDRVFVVHGHDGEMTQATARVLERLGLEPIVLEDQANGGRTVIEKLDRCSDVSFSVILLSPDDLAYKRGGSPEEARPRARQNVVHELGYFTGKLGRGNVMALYREAVNFETPSNHAGVLYAPYDMLGQWKFSLVKELRECGYSVDANALL